MLYRLDELATLAAELGLETRRVDADRLDVIIDDAVLAFCNVRRDADSRIGFEGTPWHAHDHVNFMTGQDTYLECDELEILVGLRSGELLIVSEFVGGVLRDRWITHRDEPLKLHYIEPGDELRIRRVGGSPSPNRSAERGVWQ